MLQVSNKLAYEEMRLSAWTTPIIYEKGGADCLHLVHNRRILALYRIS